jgi:mannose-1-phosphate guanylyltransferase
VKAVLLGAGRGTRLAPLTDSVPKILAPVAGRPLLEHQLRYLELAGVTSVALNVHHLADTVVRALEGIDTGLNVHVFHEPQLLGTAGALRPMADFLDEPFALLYGDVLTNAGIADLLDAHRAGGALATLAFYRSEETREKGLLELDASGRVTAFVEKPEAWAGEGNVNAGLYALSPGILRFIAPGPQDFGHDVWPRVLAAGEPIRGHEIHAYLRDIGSPEALAGAERDMTAGALGW